jgi:hypothetical protein
MSEASKGKHVNDISANARWSHFHSWHCPEVYSIGWLATTTERKPLKSDYTELRAAEKSHHHLMVELSKI